MCGLCSLCYMPIVDRKFGRGGTIVRGIIANPVVRECARSVNAVGTKNRLMTVLIHNGNVLATRIIMRAVNLLKRIRSKVSR